MDAIARITSRCNIIRQLIRDQRCTIHEKRGGVRAAALTGGLLLSVDLSKAFDVLPHKVLANALLQAAFPQDLVATILDFHSRVKFCLREHGVQAASGFRQRYPTRP